MIKNHTAMVAAGHKIIDQLADMQMAGATAEEAIRNALGAITPLAQEIMGREEWVLLCARVFDEMSRVVERTGKSRPS